MTTQPQNRAFTVSEYYRMAEADILTEEDRVELIAGQIVAMSPIGSRHAACVDRLNGLLHRQLEQAFIVRVQSPVALDAYSEPEPDLVLLRARADFYAAAHPSAADVLLAIEVADTSVKYDREVKLPLYAQAGIPEVWLIDLQKGHIEVYARPQSGTYQQRVEVAADATFTSPTVAGLELAVADVLGE